MAETRYQSQVYGIWAIGTGMIALFVLAVSLTTQTPMPPAFMAMLSIMGVGSAFFCGYSLAAWKYAPLMTTQERIAAQRKLFINGALWGVSLVAGCLSASVPIGPIIAVQVSSNPHAALVSLIAQTIIVAAAARFGLYRLQHPPPQSAT